MVKAYIIYELLYIWLFKNLETIGKVNINIYAQFYTKIRFLSFLISSKDEITVLYSKYISNLIGYF